MVTESDVLEFFRGELSIPFSLTSGRIHLDMDTVLQDYSESDELPYVIEDYSNKFSIDISSMNIEAYYPFVEAFLFKRLFKRSQIEAEMMHIRKPLTVRMFAESAKAGRWLFD